MAEHSRERVLKSIKAGISSAGGEAHSGDSPRDSHQFGETAAWGDKKTLAAQFADELAKVSGVVKMFRKTGELQDFISQFAAQNSSQAFSMWQTDFLNSLKLRQILTDMGLRECAAEDKSDTATADFGVTEADFAIADTGTLVLLSAPNKPRTASLVPPVHIAVLKSENITPNIHELFGKLPASGLPACMTFITGPSRTADIELNLTLGVHGPKELFVLILGSD
ncbi:MAG: LutC/YkgG family protein [Deltaproteobacteria bacterium]